MIDFSWDRKAPKNNKDIFFKNGQIDMGGVFLYFTNVIIQILLELYFEEKFIKFNQVQCFLSCSLF